MNKALAMFSALIFVCALVAACGKKKPSLDMSAVNAGVAAMGSQLPMHLGVDLTLMKASVVGDQAEFEYSSPYPSKVQVPPRATGLMRGSMLQYACGNATARSILNAGATINHRVIDAEGHELFATTGDLAACDIYK
jgi:hypothetical protein